MANQSVDRDPEITESIPSGPSFADILSEFESSHRAEAAPGPEGRTGEVAGITAELVFVDIGLKTEGVIPVSEFREPDGTLSVKTGDKVVVTVRGRDSEGYYQLSKVRVERPKDWSGLEAAFAAKTVIGGVVTGLVKGGLTVDVGSRAFLPASRSGARDAAELEKLVGQEIKCRITKLDVADEDVVVDRRSVLEEEAAKEQQERFGTLAEGSVVTGTVRTLMDYGAFVDIGGGIDGLLHVADISWGRVNKPADVLTAGQPIDVKILKIDPARRRVSLGRKQLEPDPWSLAQDKYQVGARLGGAVTRVTDFGAFVELEPGLEGLIHLSEMSWTKKVRKPSDVVKTGDAVQVQILGVNAADRRIALGLKQAMGDPWEGVAQKFPVGSVAEGPITSLTKFGAFVALSEGVEGMIHIGDMSAEKRLNHPQEMLKTGETVRAQVLEVDPSRRRIRLGLKQLQPTSLDEYIAERKEGDAVTGRVISVSAGRARVELGEGVNAICALPEASQESAAQSGAGQVDLSALTSMLTAKWKQGKAVLGGGGESKDSIRAGQVRAFRIVRLDAAQKRIDLELA